MKKCAAVCAILFAVLLVCFTVSVAATGVGDEGFRVSFYGLNGRLRFGDISTKVYQAGEEYVSSLARSETVKKIDLGISAAHAAVRVEDTDMIEVYYKAGRSGIRFGCEIRNETLTVREDAFFWTFFDLGGDPSELELVLPAREYERIEFSAASGSIRAEDLICEKFSAGIASGAGNFRIFAEEIELSAASGAIVAENCTDRAARSITVDCASGTHIIRGFAADTFDIDLASGNVTLEQISGKGNIDLASGNVYLDYAKWDGDLDIDAMSGTVEARLPAGSGAIVELEAMSGGVSAELDGERLNLRGDSSGKVGGGNMHRVNVDLASGSVKLLNSEEIPEEPQEDPPENGGDVPPTDTAAEGGLVPTFKIENCSLREKAAE